MYDGKDIHGTFVRREKGKRSSIEMLAAATLNPIQSRFSWMFCDCVQQNICVWLYISFIRKLTKHATDSQQLLVEYSSRITLHICLNKKQNPESVEVLFEIYRFYWLTFATKRRHMKQRQKTCCEDVREGKWTWNRLWILFFRF